MKNRKRLVAFCFAQVLFLAFCLFEVLFSFKPALIGVGLALALVVLDVRVVILTGKKSNSPTALSALCLFFSLCGAVFAGVYGSGVYIAASAVGVACAVTLDWRTGSGKIFANIVRALSIVLAVAFIVLATGRALFISFGKTTVVKSAVSPDGRYEARLLDIDEGALGGSTAVDVARCIDLGLGKADIYTMRVYSSSWVSGEALREWEFEWTDDWVLNINGAAVAVSLADKPQVLLKELVVNGHYVDIIIDDNYTQGSGIKYLTLHEYGQNRPSDAFVGDDISVYTAAYGCFDSYIADGRVMNTLVDMKLTDENGAPVEITPELKSIFEAVSKVRHSVMEMYILKPDGEYYVAVELNVNLWTPCLLYWFDTKSNTLTEICEKDDVKYTGIRLRPATSA